ncbi:MAG TPA: hypothetical protein VFV38_33360 [Ktedonobacteraceae bacterium]|nr:hypothetical protein [Ktedonobacteraceae bacterium]
MLRTEPAEHQILTRLPLHTLTHRLPLRRLSAAGVARLQNSMQRSGFLDHFPRWSHSRKNH